MSVGRYRRVGLGAGAALGATAFAAPAAQAVDIPVTNLNDDNAGSLRAAIAMANGTAASDNIVFQSGLSGQITLTTGEIPITQPVSVLGPGATQITVSGDADDMGIGDSRIFFIDLATAGQAVSISGLTMTEGFSGVSPPNGGAINNIDADLTLLEAAVTDSDTNPMDGAGGAIATSGPLRVERSTISGSTAAVEGGSGEGYGGGIAVYGSSQTDIVDSTISGNQGSVGGGIWTMSSGALNITSSTIASNQGALGDGVSDAGGPLTIQSTIAADNGNTDVSSPDANVGFSLIESSSIMALTSTGPNIIGVDPQLDALGPHGGPTQTHQPAGSSPAIDKGSASGLTFDQRGLARTADFAEVGNAAGGDGTDIGSLERDLLEPGPGPIVGEAKSGRLCLGERATIIGTKGKDKLRGTSDRDVISGKAGNDTIRGLEGNDLICGDKGKDRIKGGGGDDTVRGGNGGDSVRGGAGDDTLRGGGGPDSLFGEGGSDALFGGSKSGGRGGGGGGGGSPAVNRCDGGEGTDAATGCERTTGVP